MLAAFTIGVWKPQVAVHNCSEEGHRAPRTPSCQCPQKLTFSPAVSAGSGSRVFRAQCVDYDAATDVSGL